MNPTKHRYKQERNNEAECCVINWRIRECLKSDTFTRNEMFNERFMNPNEKKAWDAMVAIERSVLKLFASYKLYETSF